jgi:uncharacterized protein (DUF58 family)
MARLSEAIRARLPRRRRKGNAELVEGDERRARRRRRRRSVLLALGLAVTAVPPFFISGPISYLPIMTLLLLILFSYLYLQALKRSLRVETGSLAGKCERGEEAEFSVGLANSSVLAYPRLDLSFFITDLFGDYDDVERVATTLSPRESRDFRFGARFSHVGTYEAGVERLAMGDLVGLFTGADELDDRHTVTVMPHRIDMADVELKSVETEEARKLFQPVVSDNMDYTGVREYAFGDPMKAVHWNLSSRVPEGPLYTRLYEVYTNPGLQVVVDPYAPDYDAEGLMFAFDGLVESAYSVNEAAREAGIDSTVTYLGRGGEARHASIAGEDDVQDMVEDMMRPTRASDPRADASAGVELLVRAGRSIHGAGNVVYCASRLVPEAAEALYEIKAHRRNPMLLLSVPPGLDREREEQIRKSLRPLEDARVATFIVRPLPDRTVVSGL